MFAQEHPGMNGTSRKGIEYWADKLIHENLLLMTRAANGIAGMAGSDESSFSDLACSILQDPVFTTQILKLSNSPYYNPGNYQINTVSRAVMRLGFETVKVMCLSIALAETFLSSLHYEKVALEIARAFHAAAQAKRMALRRRLSGVEEIFIAALLSRIGHIAFWSFSGETGNRLEWSMKGAGSEESVEVEVLGFNIERLSLRLCREWKLATLLESALLQNDTRDPRARCVKLGIAVAKASEKGWDSLNAKQAIQESSQFLRISEKEAEFSAHEAAKTAAEITESYGAKKSCRFIPIPESLDRPDAPGGPTSEENYPQSDPQIQLSSLRDLASIALSQKRDLNLVLSILLEGIYRGVGMDRVLFAALSPTQDVLQGKYGLGWTSERLISNFNIQIGSSTHIFEYALENPKPIWISDEPQSEFSRLLSRQVYDLIGTGPFFLMTILVTNKRIGVVYADRKLSGRKLDEKNFEDFTFFGQQAQIALAVSHQS